MKALERRLIFVAAAVLCLSFAGCASSADGNAAKDENTRIVRGSEHGEEEQSPDNDERPDDGCPDDGCPDGRCPERHRGHGHGHGRHGRHGWRRVMPHPIAPPEDGDGEGSSGENMRISAYIQP